MSRFGDAMVVSMESGNLVDRMKSQNEIFASRCAAMMGPTSVAAPVPGVGLIVRRNPSISLYHVNHRRNTRLYICCKAVVFPSSSCRGALRLLPLQLHLRV